MAKCACCSEVAFVYVSWGTQGQKENLCSLHAKELHERISGPVARLEMPSPIYSAPIEDAV